MAFHSAILPQFRRPLGGWGQVRQASPKKDCRKSQANLWGTRNGAYQDWSLPKLSVTMSGNSWSRRLRSSHAGTFSHWWHPAKAEHIYATNKKELLAIDWAFKNFENYVYGVNNIEIYTDQKPLSFSIFQKNPNIEMKRWYSFIESYSPKIIYKPGSTSVVADALSNTRNPKTSLSNNC